MQELFRKEVDVGKKVGKDDEERERIKRNVKEGIKDVWSG